MTPEGKVKKECRAYLKSIGAYVFSPVQMGYGAASVDDLVCYRGHFVAIEYKRADADGRVTTRQKQCLKAVEDAGGLSFLIRARTELEVAFDLYGLHKI